MSVAHRAGCVNGKRTKKRRPEGRRSVPEDPLFQDHDAVGVQGAIRLGHRGDPDLAGTAGEVGRPVVGAVFNTFSTLILCCVSRNLKPTAKATRMTPKKLKKR